MNVRQKLESMLVEKRMPYDLVDHPVAFTAQTTAEMEHISGKKEAKVVMLSVDGMNVMAVVPATHRIDMLKVRYLFGTEDIRLEAEEEFVSIFQDCEPGAMPPFGELYGVPVVVDLSLAENNTIVFNAGTHSEAMRMAYKDYEKIVSPIVGDIAVMIH